ncbi:MAG: helix-turn-helix transcriptional regulator [Proteobacteria bacterium]|nr:helix-turn-helix transcriptional regulator [Pseudomonadota bacterium]
MLNYRSTDIILRALADPTRREIVEILCESDYSVLQIASPMSMTLAAVMQHLRVLEKSGVIYTEKRGRIRWCRIDPHALRVLSQWVDQQCGQWERRHAQRRNGLW